MMEKGEGNFPIVLAIVAALNEEEGVGVTIAELRRYLEKPRILVVDGNSSDRTIEVAKDMDAEVVLQEGKGKGDAIAAALKHVNMDVDYVVFTDADYTYPAEYLPEMIRILEANPKVGMVCGNRFNHHLKAKAMKNAFYFGNRVLAFSHNLLNGVTMRDPLTGLRAVRWELLKGWQPKSKDFDIEVEMNHHVERRGFDIAEVDIDYRPRLGEKKLKLRHGALILKRILSESVY
jgi:dolichol-phosphate mannosyltransferase